MGCVMAKNTVTINGNKYKTARRKVGQKLNENGVWVPDYRLFYGKTKKEAVAKADAYTNNLNRGITNKPLYFGELMDRFIKEVFKKDSRYKDSTKKLYISSYNANVRDSNFAGQLIKNIKSIDLQTLYNSLTCGPSTVKAIHKLIKLFYVYLEKEEICRDITGNIVLPKVVKKNGNTVEDGNIETWTDEELKIILDGSSEHRLHLLFVLAAYTGCRISELLGLTYEDITDNALMVNKQAYESKTVSPKSDSSVRAIPLSEYVVNEVREHKTWHTEEMLKNNYRTDFIFTTQTGKLYDRHNIYHACSRLYKRLGVTSRPFHAYRHTFATKLAKSGVSIQTVAALLGHSDTEVTSKYYINVDMEDKTAAISKLKIDAL